LADERHVVGRDQVEMASSAVGVQGRRSATGQKPGKLLRVVARLEQHDLVVAQERHKLAVPPEREQLLEHRSAIRTSVNVVAERDDLVAFFWPDGLGYRRQRRRATVDVSNRNDSRSFGFRHARTQSRSIVRNSQQAGRAGDYFVAT
jgi:hypothetical protein